MKILLTALPGTGKSTIIKKVIDSYHGGKYGIVSLEMRDDSGQRTGFKAVNLEGESQIFMHATDIDSEYAVGRFKVDIDVLDSFVSSELKKGIGKPEALLLIDEIGRAQILSEEFLKTVRDIFSNDSNFLGTIVYEPEEWSLEFKSNPEVIVLEVSLENREYLPDILLAIYENNHLFEKLNENQKTVIKEEFISFIKKGMYVQAKKLFFNTVPYIATGKIKKISETNSDVRYAVEGKTNDHVTTYTFSTKEYSCDCDLFLGKNQFEGDANKLCSHIESVKLFNL
jgi:nucleoside-triphosphatase